MSDLLYSGLFVVGASVSGALIAVAYQYWQYTKQLKLSRLAEIASEKKAVILDLVAYRFVLTGRGYAELPVTHFNAALSKVPVLFSSNKDCMDIYRSITLNFTVEKYYELIVALMKDVPLSTEFVDMQLLETIPSVAPRAGTS